MSARVGLSEFPKKWSDSRDKQFRALAASLSADITKRAEKSFALLSKLLHQQVQPAGARSRVFQLAPLATRSVHSTVGRTVLVSLYIRLIT